MARFDPRTYPDRLGFEAHARRIRRDELGRTFDAALAWFDAWQAELASRFGRHAAAAARAHRHSPR